MKIGNYHTYGANSVFTFVKLRGRILPVVASDDQYCVQFPDGTQLWVEKWECQSLWNSVDKNSSRNFFRKNRNKPSSKEEIDEAFQRNSGKFLD